VRGQLVGQLRGLIGEEGALAVQGLIQSAWLADGITFKTLLSVATLLLGASAVFSELSEDVNLLWKVPPRPGSGPIGAFLRVRLLSIGLVVGVGFLLVVSLVLDTVVTALQDRMWPPDDAVRVLMGIVNQVSALLLLGATFALLMKAMPRTRVRWREVTLGAAVASVLLMWLFYSASVFLYGVAFARAWSEEGGAVLPAGPARPTGAGSVQPDMR
jgi:membrane protein